MDIQLEILSPEKTIYKGKVSSIRVPGSLGDFTVLQYHAPIISTLEKGKIKIEEQGGNPEYFDIEGGIVEVHKNKAIILAEEP
ncbi:MAG: ATP synthase F1 subunit epsilon [Bacteroidales bacterium]